MQKLEPLDKRHLPKIVYSELTRFSFQGIYLSNVNLSLALDSLINSESTSLIYQSTISVFLVTALTHPLNQRLGLCRQTKVRYRPSDQKTASAAVAPEKQPIAHEIPLEPENYIL